MRSVLLCTLMLAGLAGCDRPAPAPVAPASETPQTDTSAIAATIRAIEAQWAKDIVAGNADRIVSHYADDAAVMIPDAPARIGLAEIRAGLPATISDGGFTMSFRNVRTTVSSSGDLAYTRGTVVQSVPGNSDVPQTQTSNDLTIFKKQRDGSWRAIEDITSPA